MAAVAGYKGFVTSWASPNDTTLSLFGPLSFTVQVNAEEYDSTAFIAGSASAKVRTRIKGLRDWTAELEAHKATPRAGHLGNLTGTNIYAYNPRGWDLTINADTLDTTTFQPTNNWRTFRAGLVSWELNYECFVDDANAVTLPDAAAGTTASFTATVYDTSNLQGEVVVTGCNIVSRVADMALVRYSCMGTGHLTTVGTENILPASTTLSIPTASLLTLKTYDDGTDKILSGSAFWTSLRISTQVGQGIQLNASVRGAGELSST